MVIKITFNYQNYFWLSKLLLVIKIGFIYVIIMIIWILYDLLSLYVCLYGVLTYKSLVARNYFICKIWIFKNLIRTILFDNIDLYSFFYSILWNWRTQLSRRGKNQHFWHRIFPAQLMQYGTYFKVDKDQNDTLQKYICQKIFYVTKFPIENLPRYILEDKTLQVPHLKFWNLCVKTAHLPIVKSCD